MKSNRLFSILRQKLTKWILFFLILGICVFLLWPNASLFYTDISIPVKHKNIPNDRTLSAPFPKGIEVRISGSKSAIKNLKDHSLQYHLDLSGVAVGDHSIPINKDFISLPSDVVITKIKPPFLTITIEKQNMKIVPITVSLLNKPAAGYIISKTSTSPNSVPLKGPKSLIDPIKKIRTKPVDVNGAFESFKKETTLDLAEGVQNIRPSEAILVEISIQKKIDIRKFQDVPVKGLNTNYKYHISPSLIEIKVKGPVNVLDKLDVNKNIKVHIDLKELIPGIYMKPAIILLPVDITLIQVEPEVFTVKIDNKSAISE